MGDGGAMLVGFLMATLSLKIRPEGAGFPVSWLVPILILGVPVFDTSLVSISRARRGLVPFTSPGKDHTAHRLSNMGLGHRGAVLALYCLAGLYGMLALLIPRISAGMAYVLAGVLVVFGLLAVFFLESVPYERQVKLNKSPAA
jgi:UDP-GlcNAc:undecaprenyl-phosphate GlcNAc-1-phosphate transferase